MIKLLKYALRPTYNRFVKLINNLLLLQSHPTLKLGDSVSIYNSKFGQYVYLSTGTNVKNTEFGDFTYCGENTKLANAIVGRFTCIGPSVTIGMGRHPLDRYVSVHPAFYSTAAQVGKTFAKEQMFKEHPSRTSIGNDVWIGAGVIIPGGITIGDGAVIATGAVVVRDVLPFEVVGGIPANQIKFRFSEGVRKSLLEIKWWDWSLSKIEDRASTFLDFDEFTTLN